VVVFGANDRSVCEGFARGPGTPRQRSPWICRDRWFDILACRGDFRIAQASRTLSGRAPSAQRRLLPPANVSSGHPITLYGATAASCSCPFIAAAVEIPDPGHPACLHARDYEQLALLLDGASARSRVLNTEAFTVAAAIAAVLVDNAIPTAATRAGAPAMMRHGTDEACVPDHGAMDGHVIERVAGARPGRMLA
jgi:hypothetical protein